MGSTITLQQLEMLKQWVTEFSSLGDDYVLMRLTRENRPPTGRPPRHGPIRIDGMAWILCFGGRMDMEVNLDPITVGAGCVSVIEPNAIIDIKEIEWDELDCYMLFCSSTFLRDVNFDVNTLGSLPHPPAIGAPRTRVMQLTAVETDTLRHYFTLLRRSAMSDTAPNPLLAKSIARTLVAALNYQLMQFFTNRVAELPEPPVNAPRSRRSGYVRDFMRLVQEHHRHERAVTFYASRLFISPKYLSMLTKEAMGQSASEIIDGFVILEAKNLLRFSGKNIQQIAYELNFSTQSSFGKYFKHNTGMSPSEYQRS